MNLFTARCAQVRKAQLAFYAAADAAAAAPTPSAEAQDAFVAALAHFQTVRREAEAQFPGLTMAEVHFAAGF